MFNVAVIRLKDVIRYILFGVGIIIIILLCKKISNKKKVEKINIGKSFTKNINQYIEKSLDVELHNAQQEEKREEKKQENNLLNKIIGLELGVINIKEKQVDSTEVSNEVGQNVKNEESNLEESYIEDDEKDDKEEKLAKENVKTEVITNNPIADSYTKKYKGVKIKNETSYDLIDNELNYEKLKIDKSNIIIFHTHTCESYTSSKKYSYTPTGNYRTTDIKYSVARVGDELTKYLKKYNLNVIHNKTYHDYPSYNGSYSRSLSTVSNILKKTKADIIIDLHRDAIGSYSGYAPTVKIGDDECAQLMFVIGTDGGKLKHPNWKSNLQFAIKLQELANKEYPGLFKPIIVRNSRYNQHLGKAACIIEVGSTGNKLEQCLNSMKYLSRIINDF